MFSVKEHVDITHKPDQEMTESIRYCGVIQRFFNHPHARAHYCELFELTDVRFKHWAFISNSLRMDITIFRENRAEDLRKNGVVIEDSWMNQFVEITQQPCDNNSKDVV